MKEITKAKGITHISDTDPNKYIPISGEIDTFFDTDDNLVGIYNDERWKTWNEVIYSNVDEYTPGELWSWGRNNNGQLGDSTTISKSSPVQIGTLTSWKMISTGYEHHMAIKTDGTLWAWGLNDNGQLGDGTTVSKSSPIQIGTLTDWKKIISSYKRCNAIKTDGTLWAWGNNDYGNLGDDTIISKSNPVQVGTSSNWKSIFAGYYNNLAIKKP